jgi:ribosomal protein L37AE/L43A
MEQVNERSSITRAKQYRPRCKLCGEIYQVERMRKGYAVCLPCGDEIAKERKFTVAPMHKSNYVLITDRTDLVGLNNKGGLVK